MDIRQLKAYIQHLPDDMPVSFLIENPNTDVWEKSDMTDVYSDSRLLYKEVVVLELEHGWVQECKYMNEAGDMIEGSTFVIV